MSYQLTKFCAEKNIILVGCPEEMAVTRSVFKNIIDGWPEIKSGRIINKVNLAPSLQPVFSNHNIESIIRESYSGCSIYPFKKTAASAKSVAPVPAEPKKTAKRSRTETPTLITNSNGLTPKRSTAPPVKRPSTPNPRAETPAPVATSSKDVRRSGRSSIMNGLRLQEILIRSSSSLFANYIETWVDSDIKAQFMSCRSAGVWSGDSTYKKLFDLWYQLATIDE
ncbi:hypothetical protein QYM36_008055 [Artemia franciscana]|uniref:Uncharacterized protein n=1 Tax=Artemia franciscana TaxID=6661 RepID=A0AA88LEC6_ARTSF|nr:hypothetical protein QYM36_008055 [Artemia franciscana]